MKVVKAAYEKVVAKTPGSRKICQIARIPLLFRLFALNIPLDPTEITVV